MAHPPSDRFRIFISHKHDDHAFAESLERQLEGLSDRIKCFVSGVNLTAGADWNAEIRSQLLVSHLLILLFTEPSKNWDWCLYEAGLFTSLGEEHSVVCLYRAEDGSPRPLSNLQGVPVEPQAVQRFLTQLCEQTWLIAQKWRMGALHPKVDSARVAQLATTIVDAFPRRAATAPAGPLTHFPCHRVVLDLRQIDTITAGIPLDARVVEGEGATSTFTLSLFNLTQGLRSRTWGDLVEATDKERRSWLADLDFRFDAALKEQLFSPSKTTPMPLVDAYTGLRKRSYRPVLYEILRERVRRADGTAGRDELRPVQLTLVLDPVAEPAA